MAMLLGGQGLDLPRYYCPDRFHIPGDHTIYTIAGSIGQHNFPRHNAHDTVTYRVSP